MITPDAGPAPVRNSTGCASNTLRVLIVSSRRCIVAFAQSLLLCGFLTFASLSASAQEVVVRSGSDRYAHLAEMVVGRRMLVGADAISILETLGSLELLLLDEVNGGIGACSRAARRSKRSSTGSISTATSSSGRVSMHRERSGNGAGIPIREAGCGTWSAPSGGS